MPRRPGSRPCSRSPIPPLPSVSDVKTYLGLTTSGDDTLIAERLQAAVGMAERDTGRVFASGSNSTTVYSTNGEAVVPIDDRPMTDASRVVTWNGATMTEGTNVWFLPDRRDQNISRQVQIRPFDTGRADWFKADPMWFDKNLDNARYGYSGVPNDLSISGVIGHPFPKSDVTGAILVLTAFLYWRAKSGASGTAYDANGEAFTLADTPPEYQAFVRDWKATTAVARV